MCGAEQWSCSSHTICSVASAATRLLRLTPGPASLGAGRYSVGVEKRAEDASVGRKEKGRGRAWAEGNVMVVAARWLIDKCPHYPDREGPNFQNWSQIM